MVCFGTVVSGGRDHRQSNVDVRVRGEGDVPRVPSDELCEASAMYCRVSDTQWLEVGLRGEPKGKRGYSCCSASVWHCG